jgi:hypothetical protein
MDNDYDNNEEKDNDKDKNDDDEQFYSESQSFDDIDFKDSYNEVSNSNIDSIISNDFKRYNREENQGQ